jgi:polysaccharide chain length determinant protein (PEP-CTERM system associated)
MEEKKEIAMIEHYLQLVLRRRWLVIIPLCLAMAGGLTWSLKAPKLFESKTMILVVPQKVPGDVVKPIISQETGSRITTVSQQILSRSNLEKIIQDFQLFADEPAKKTFMEDKVESVSKRIAIQVTRTGSKEGEEAFSIAYIDHDPNTAMRVANALASNFIEANLQTREETAAGTSDFLEVELEGMRDRLEQLDSKLRDYRKQYMGELPEQLDANLRILESLGKQLDDRKERLRSERSRLVIVENEIDQLKRDLDRERSQVPGVARGTDAQADRSAPTLPQLYDQLAGMRAAYTDIHPDVIRLQKKIEDMQRELNRRSSERTAEPGVTPAPEGIQSVTSNQLADRSRQRMSIQADIGNLQQDVVKVEREIREYQQRIERTPKREEELRSLKRDYENLQTTYDSVLKRKLEAGMAVNLEKKKKGEQFRVLDYAKVPEKPFSPDIKKIFLISLAIGLGTGLGIIYMLGFLDASVQRKEDLLAIGVPLLVTIPRIYDERAKARMRANNLASVLVSLAIGTVAVGFAFMAFMGVAGP